MTDNKYSTTLKLKHASQYIITSWNFFQQSVDCHYYWTFWVSASNKQ